MLVEEGSGSLGSVVFLDTVRRRRTLLRGSCGRSFLIPCGRLPINDQSKYTMVLVFLTFVAQHRVVPPNFSGVSFCLRRGHIDWKEEGGTTGGFILPLS